MRAVRLAVPALVAGALLCAGSPALAEDAGTGAADPTAAMTQLTTSTPSTATATVTVGTTPTPAPTVGGKGAFSYPFVLTAGEVNSLSVVGTGVVLDYGLDEQGKVVDAVVAAGDATLVSATPHTVKLVLDSGSTVMVKVHGDRVRVKVKPLQGGPLRTALTDPTAAPSAVATATATATPTATGSPTAAEVGKPSKASKPSRPSKPSRAPKAGKPSKAEKPKKARAPKPGKGGGKGKKG